MRTTIPVTTSGFRVYGSTDIEGRLAVSRKLAEAYAAKSRPFIYLRNMTEPEDVEIMRKAEAVVTIEGGPTCHAAIVCVTMGVPCLTGVEKISKTFTLDGKKLKNGLRVSITRDQITFEIPNGEKK